MNRQTIEQGLGRAIFVSFCFLIFFLPISIALLETAAAFAIFFFILKKMASFYFNAKTNRPRSFFVFLRSIVSSLNPAQSFLNTSIALFVIAFGISVVFSHYPSLSIYSFIGKTLSVVCLFFSFLECMTSQKRLCIFLMIYAISTTLIGINGIYQYMYGIDFIRKTHLGLAHRVSSCLRHPNGLGAYLIFGISFLFAFLIAQFKGWKLKSIAAVLCIIGFVCLGLTYSRGAWIGLMVALLLAGFLQKRILVVIALIAIFCTVFFPLLADVRKVSILTDNIQVQQTSHNNNMAILKEKFANMSGSGRLIFWQEACGMIKDYPIVGVGLNNYSIVIHHYKIDWAGYPHNSYLQMTAETGFLGLFAFLGMMFVLFKNTLNNLRRMKNMFWHGLLCGMLGGLLGFMIESFVDTTFYSVQLWYLMWVMMGVIVSIQKFEEVYE